MSNTMDLEQGTTQAKGQAPATTSDVVLVSADPGPNEGCQCSAGWVLFGVGWVMPLCWLVGAFLPFCTKNRNDKRAAIGSGVMILVYGLVLGLVLGLYVVPLIALTNAAFGANMSAASQLTAASANLAAQMADAQALAAAAAAAQAAATGQVSSPAPAGAPAASPALSGGAGTTGNLTCYQGVGGNKVQAVLMNNKESKPLFCSKYSIVCNPQQVSCTADQIAASAVVWNCFAASSSTCSSLGSMPSMFPGFVCCSTDLCNAPDPAADPGAEVVSGVITVDWA